MANLTRRTILQLLPFAGASVAIPVAAAAPVEAMTPQEQFDHHFNALAALINQNAGDCNGWTATISSHPVDHDGFRLRGARFWVVGEMVRGRLLPLDRMRDFDPRTGLSTDWRDDPQSHHTGGI